MFAQTQILSEVSPEIVSGPPMHVGHVTSQPYPGPEPGALGGLCPPRSPRKAFGGACGAQFPCPTKLLLASLGLRRRRCPNGPLRRGGGGWGAGRRLGRLLAGRSGAPRRRRGEETLPAGEDLWRRADTPGGPPVERDGPGRAAGGVPPVRRAAVDGPRSDPRTGVAEPRRLPVLRLRGDP